MEIGDFIQISHSSNNFGDTFISAGRPFMSELSSRGLTVKKNHVNNLYEASNSQNISKWAVLSSVVR